MQSESELYHVNWFYLTLFIDLIGQLGHDTIGCLSISYAVICFNDSKMLLVCFDPSFVTVLTVVFVIFDILSIPDQLQ